ncbi:hypothetical protein C8R43DRAFT_946774 [Mycena crocata]|nr:hypothetical protein C8R43DRAFT_946774 [Mycena crocata]
MEIYSDNEADRGWNPGEWISAGKIYHDVPDVVEAARRNLLQIPTSFINNLPSKTMSISQLLRCDLPPRSDNVDIDVDWGFFAPTKHTADIEDILMFLVLPTRSTLDCMVETFGQAWFDGNKSIHISLNPDIAFPFWALTYWREMLEVCEARDTWIGADCWVNKRGKTAEKATMKIKVQALWNALPWHGKSHGNIPVANLPALFSAKYLGSEIIDALLALLSFRSRFSEDPSSEKNLIVDTTFAQTLCMLLPLVDGVATGPIKASSTAQAYMKKYGEWLRQQEHQCLHLVLYHPPFHWTASSITSTENRIRYGDPLHWEQQEDFFDAMQLWLREHLSTEFVVTDDLPCAFQTDGHNCGIIAVNAVAHATLGEPLWTPETATTFVDPPDCFANLLEVHPDFHDPFLPATRIEGPETVMRGEEATILESSIEAPVAARGMKRKAESEDDSDGRKRKVVKAESSESVAARNSHPFLAPKSISCADQSFQNPQAMSRGKSGVKIPAASSVKRPKKTASRASTVTDPSGSSQSATSARELNAQVRAGTFCPSARKTKNFRQTICETFDDDAEFEINSKEVKCSTCNTWVKMKCPYDTYRFKEHSEKGCEPPLPPPAPSAQPKKNGTLDAFKFVPRPTQAMTKSKKLIPPSVVFRPCPGLTVAYNSQIGTYLNRTCSSGGGARAPGHYSLELFKREFAVLTDDEKQQVYSAQYHDRTWRNDVSPGIMASFAIGTTQCLKSIQGPAQADAPAPCDSCRLLFTSKSYQATIKKPAPDQANLRYVPHRDRNAHAGELYARYGGLEALVSENNEYSLEHRFFQHVVNGDFKDDKIFNGILEAKILAKTREIKGVGMQNFHYNEDVDAVFGLIHAISPRAYREIAKHIPLRSERQTISKSPRFPIGIEDATFGYAKQYCEDYKYPQGAPLSLSVDDTKLHAALRPLYDGVKQKWFIVGTTGQPTEVPNAEALHNALDHLEKTEELATKVNFFYGFGSCKFRILAIMPTGSKVKGAQLAEWQLSLMNGLISRGFRISSSGGDGASVERECQRKTAAASKIIEYCIKHPDPDYPDIIVTVWELDGNVWVEFRDAKHGKKTFRNNASSGARGLVLGNKVVHFGQIHEVPLPGMVLQPSPDPAFEHLYLHEDELVAPAHEPTEPTAAEEVQRMIDDLHSTVGLSWADDAQLDACVMASVALSIDELARIEDLPDSNPERFAEIQRDIATAMVTHPAAFMALLQGMADSSTRSVSQRDAEINTENPRSSRPLVDISADDLAPLVTLRREHQTKEAKMGVRTYKASGIFTNPKTGVVKELSPRQCLAQKMQTIIKHDHQQGSSTGLNRSVRWKTNATAQAPKTRNAANAEATAGARAKEVIKRRRTIFGKLKCLATVVEAGIGNESQIQAGSYGFAIVGSEIVLVQVLVLYAKMGGKAAAHLFTEYSANIGALSYIFVQTYEHSHSHRQHFKNTRRQDLALRTLRFAHLPSNSLVAILPREENMVKIFATHVEIGVSGSKVFELLMTGKESLCKGVASLNTVRRKGQANIHILELVEDDGVAE